MARTSQTSEARAAAFERFSALMWGLYGTQCLYVVAKLRVADALVGGPRQVAEVAREVGADPDALERILRALVLPVGALGFRARVRRFAYTHQDAVWVALLAAFVTIMVVIVLLAA